MQSDQLQSQHAMSCIKFPVITELVYFANAEKAAVKISMFQLKFIVFANLMICMIVLLSKSIENNIAKTYLSSNILFVKSQS